jgi:ABC-type Fe3+/spermidine/putrescine transport system ATPase subunit
MKNTSGSSRLDVVHGRSGSAPLLRLTGLAKSFGSTTAVHPTDLEIEAGSFTAILGPSGCGKSTLLRMIAGFAQPTAGHIEIAGEDVTVAGPERRPTNMVFQGYGLFPHMTVAQNVGFGLAIAKTPKDQTAARVSEMLQLVRLENFADRSIDALSGGQQQRVALARALIMRPVILLLDEPLAALDLKLRQAMQEELRRIHREIGGTFIFVTHDQGEAFSLADRLIVMNEGRVEQIGVPQEIYARPKSLFVARFVGDANILPGVRRQNRVELDIGASFKSDGPDGPLAFVLRPEVIQIAEAHDSPAIAAVVDDVVLLGNEAKIVLTIGSNHRLAARMSDPARAASWKPGTRVSVAWPLESLTELSRDG